MVVILLLTRIRAYDGEKQGDEILALYQHFILASRCSCLNPQGFWCFGMWTLLKLFSLVSFTVFSFHTHCYTHTHTHTPVSTFQIRFDKKKTFWAQQTNGGPSWSTRCSSIHTPFSEDSHSSWSTLMQADTGKCEVCAPFPAVETAPAVRRRYLVQELEGVRV